MFKINKSFGELVRLTNQMQSKLPGATLEAGYAIEGPDAAGYYTIKGPELSPSAFISGSISFYHPLTKQLIFMPYIPLPIKPKGSGFPVIGWVILAAAALFLINN